MPVRIQRRRTKGWKMPEGAVSVTRPGPYGNPFVIGGYYMKGDFQGRTDAFGFLYTSTSKEYADARYILIETAEQAVEWFRWYVGARKNTFPELRGKDLACWCPVGAACHGDALLEIANAGGEIPW